MTAGAAAVGALAFSPAGKDLAAGSEDGNVRLWDVATQAQAGATMATGAPVAALSFNASGSTLATAERDGAPSCGPPPPTSRPWSVATGHRVGALMNAGSAGTGAAVAFSPDGATLATAGGDGTARSWDVAFPAGLVAAACAIADQSLTRQQWAGYAGTQPFQQVCPAS